MCMLRNVSFFASIMSGQVLKGAWTCRKKVKHIVIDGSVPPPKRQGLVNNFQNDSRVKVALLSIQAAGVGLTLTVSIY